MRAKTVERCKYMPMTSSDTVFLLLISRSKGPGLHMHFRYSQDGMHQKVWIASSQTDRPRRGKGQQTSPLDRRRGPDVKRSQQPPSNTHQHIPALADEPATSELPDKQVDKTPAHSSRLDTAPMLSNSTIAYSADMGDAGAHHDTSIIIGT